MGDFLEKTLTINVGRIDTQSQDPNQPTDASCSITGADNLGLHRETYYQVSASETLIHNCGIYSTKFKVYVQSLIPTMSTKRYSSVRHHMLHSGRQI